MVKNVNVGGVESGKPHMLQKYLASKIEKEGFDKEVTKTKPVAPKKASPPKVENKSFKKIKLLKLNIRIFS